MKMLLILAMAASVFAAEPCVLDRTFLDASLASWETVRAKELRLEPAPLPTFILFDQSCVWRDGKGSTHGGKIALPDGNEIPAQVMAFASEHDGKPFFVMALPPVWRAEARHRENPRLDLLLRSVFVHEMTHTRQSHFIGARVTELEKRHKIENLSDDIVQERFSSRDGFTAAYEKERDLLFSVASEQDATRRRTLANDALRAIRERRSRYFTKDDAHFAELEELFLSMEGVAQWAAFRAAMHEGLSREDAITLARGSGRWFSQEEGLALFLAIDALVPDWQKRVFRDEPAAAFHLLE